MRNEVKLELIYDVCKEIIKEDPDIYSEQIFDEIWNNLEVEADVITSPLVVKHDDNGCASFLPDKQIIEAILLGIVSSTIFEVLKYEVVNLLKSDKKLKKIIRRVKRKNKIIKTEKLDDGTIIKTITKTSEIVISRMTSSDNLRS